MSNGITSTPRQQQRNFYWQKCVDYLNASAEISNIGIFIEVLGRWFPAFAGFISATPFAYIFIMGDPLIYFFRSLIRLTRILGRTFFNVQFEEDKNGPPHKLQFLGDFLSLSCFTLTVALFCGALVAPPIGITLAWALGLCGLGIISFFDYVWPERQAAKKFQAVCNNENAGDEMKETAHKDYTRLKKSREMYCCVLGGLALLLICGSAAAFAPPLLVPFLYVISNAASLFLGGIACARFYHWRRLHNKEEAKTHKDPVFSSTPTHSNSEIEMTPLKAQLKLLPNLAETKTKIAVPHKTSLPSPSQTGLFRPKMVIPRSCKEDVRIEKGSLFHCAGLSAPTQLAY